VGSHRSTSYNWSPWATGPPTSLCFKVFSRTFFQFPWPRRYDNDGAFTYIELSCREVEVPCLDGRINKASCY
jgi:hypothetical protein